MAKISFGVFSNPIKGVVKNIPTLLLSEAVTPDSDKVVLVDGEMHRRPMRSHFLTTEEGVPVPVPDGNPIMEMITFLKEDTNDLYLLVLTKKHIYLWDSTTTNFTVKHEFGDDVEFYDYTIFGGEVIVVPDKGLILSWDGSGNFKPFDTPYGVRVGYSIDPITTISTESAKDIATLNVTSSAEISVDDVLIIDKGGTNEEVVKVKVVDDGTTLTLYDNLNITHSISEEVHKCVCITNAKYITEYSSRLFIAYPYVDQDTKAYPCGIYISALNTPDFGTTSAVGYFGIGQTGEIRGFGKYQGLLYIFKNNSRVQMFPVASEEYFNYNEIADNFGLLATHSVINDDAGNMYYLATDKTIKVEGGGSVSQPIQTEILNKIQPDALNKVCSAYVKDYGELMWAIPVGSSNNNYVIVFKDGVWLLIKNVSVTCFTDFYYTDESDDEGNGVIIT